MPLSQGSWHHIITILCTNINYAHLYKLSHQSTISPKGFQSMRDDSLFIRCTITMLIIDITYSDFWESYYAKKTSVVYNESTILFSWPRILEIFVYLHANIHMYTKYKNINHILHSYKESGNISRPTFQHSAVPSRKFPDYISLQPCLHF